MNTKPQHPECYWQKFSFDPTRHCKEPGLFKRRAIGSETDNWTWCAHHIGLFPIDTHEEVQDE